MAYFASVVFQGIQYQFIILKNHAIVNKDGLERVILAVIRIYKFSEQNISKEDRQFFIWCLDEGNKNLFISETRPFFYNILIKYERVVTLHNMMNPRKLT